MKKRRDKNFHNGVTTQISVTSNTFFIKSIISVFTDIVTFICEYIQLYYMKPTYFILNKELEKPMEKYIDDFGTSKKWIINRALYMFFKNEGYIEE